MGLLDKIGNQNKIVEFLGRKIDSLLNEDKDSSLKKLQKDTLELKRKVDKLKRGGELNTTYEKIEIYFNNKVKLELPEYGARVFERELNGRMHFLVLGINEESNYMLLKIKGWPKSFKMKLGFNTLEIGDKQSGQAFLIYDFGEKYSEGPKESVYYDIKRLYKK